MDRLWTPWRYKYIKGETGEKTGSAPGCVFCSMIQTELQPNVNQEAQQQADERNFILHRAAYSFIVLNIYPYTSGHLLIVPYEHIADLDEANKNITDELMDLTKRCQTLLREVYRPHGMNIGVNQGAAAGAGVAEHLHLHILPRWHGDANFMTTIGETRVLPEGLDTTYRKLRERF